MREFIKKHCELFYALFFAAILSFVFAIVEPITMYASNIDDFWFDYYTLIGPSTIAFAIVFSASIIIFTIIYFFSRIIKKPGLFRIIFLFSIFCFICAYIHSNFLSGFLPSLDGSIPDYSDFLPNLISICVVILLAGILIFLSIKIGLQKTVRYSFFTTIAFFIMSLVSLGTIYLTTSVLEPKEYINTATIDNINLVSKNHNYMILLVDAVDSTHFNNVVNSKPEYQEIFKDFSYYPDTLSGYAFTRDSIPFIFSGTWNENTEPFNKYSTKAYDNSKFFNALESKGYNKNFYSYDFVWQSQKATSFNNVASVTKGVKTKTFLKQELKYVLFKTLPYPLKSFSKIESMNFTHAQNDTESTPFNWLNVKFYHDTLENQLDYTDDNYFQFIHIEGGHTPFNLDKDVNEVDEELYTYTDKLEATLKIIAKYLNRLKSGNAYDNATIVILADHGFWYEGTSRANPILYIKSEGETHNQMLTSDKQVSYVDLCETFTELLDGKDSTEIFSELPTNGRVRRFIYNGFNEEEHMYEYEQTGKAWEVDTLNKTGKEFNL